MTGPRKLCKHCQKVISNRPRQLCWVCYYSPGVRNLYPSGTNYVGDKHKSPPASSPTTSLPGSATKMSVLANRAEAGTDLFHPEDQSLTE